MLNATLLFQYITDAAKDMLKNLYVDNIVTQSESEESAAAYYSTARAIMSDANLISGAGHQIATQAMKDRIAADPGPINVLGLQWDTATDTMSLTVKSPIPTHHTLVIKARSVT